MQCFKLLRKSGHFGQEGRDWLLFSQAGPSQRCPAAADVYIMVRKIPFLDLS